MYNMIYDSLVDMSELLGNKGPRLLAANLKPQIAAL